LNFAYIHPDLRETADPAILTRHLVDPTKQRPDTTDGLHNRFGFGFDMGDGMIETADSARKVDLRTRERALADRVGTERWRVTMRPEGRVKSRLELELEELKEEERLKEKRNMHQIGDVEEAERERARQMLNR
jgi:hypothetical protein